MTFIKDWEIWENYTRNIKKLSQNNTVVHLKPLISHPIHRILPSKAVSTILKDTQVVRLNKSEMKNFKSQRYIDLHGHTREIDLILEKFFLECISQNRKSVTVITGKGNGILKHAAEIWFNQHPEYIVAFAGIKDSMQQIGAYAIKLRTFHKNK